MTRRLLAPLAALMLCPPAAVADPRTDGPVDLQRYAGRWHELARIPNRFQSACTGGVTAQYTPRDDGRIAVVNRCRTEDGEDLAEGVARVVADDNSKLEVRFAPGWLSWLPAVWGHYWILALADDYRYAVVGDPAREYLWVLARQPHLDDADWTAIRERIVEAGYDLDRVEPTPP